MTGTVLYSYIISGPRRPKLKHVEDWHAILPAAQQLAGSSNAPVDLVVLTDYQCPACRAYHRLLMDVVDRRSGDVRAWYVHHPLNYHEQAMSAAIGAECAAQQGAFRSMVDVLFKKQDSLAMKSLASYAEEAAINDLSQFARCLEQPDQSRDARIADGLHFGEDIAMTGTPTVLVEGWQYPDPPSQANLERAIDAILADRKPPLEHD